MEKINFKKILPELYLVFENGMHHSIYHDLKLCIAHYDYLVYCRESPHACFEIYNMSYDPDVACYVPCGIVCRVFKNHIIQVKYKMDFEKISRFSPLYNVILDYRKESDSPCDLPF